MKKRKVRVTKTGYLPNSPDRNNPMNIIPSNQITMNSVPFPILGIDNLGNQQMMMPGMDYTFPGQYVTEIPMGKYVKGGLVKYQDKGQVSFDDYMMQGLRPQTSIQESTYRPIPIIEQAKKEDVKGVTPKQKVQTAANRKKIVEEEKRQQFEAELANQGEIKPAPEGTERLMHQFIYAMDQPLDAMGSLMQRGYVPQGNLNGDYETASPMSSVIGAFNPVSVVMDLGRVGRDLGEEETYTTWGGAGEGVMNAIGFLPFGNVLKKFKPTSSFKSEIDWSKDYFQKLNAKERELQKLAISKKITQADYLEQQKLYKEKLQKELGLAEEIGSGRYGSVHTLESNPNTVIKLGDPLSRGQGLAKNWTSDDIEQLKSINQNANIAVPEKVEYFEIPSAYRGYGPTTKEVLYMPNLNTSQVKNLGLNKRDRYAYFLKQARQLRDKGIGLDVENMENFKFNKDKGVFDIYDVNPYIIEDPVEYMQYIRNNTREPLFENMTYKQGGIYLGNYEFKNGGLVKMAPGGVNPGRYSDKLTIDDFNKIVDQAPEQAETFIPFRNEEPSKNISEFMGKTTSISRDLQNDKKIEDKVRKYESSSEFQLGQNVYRDPKTHINQYEKTADYKLRHKNISEYNSDDVKEIQKKLVDEGLIKSSQINLSDYKTKDDVKELQRFLVSQGLADHLGKYGENKDGVDGQLGKMTRAAIELYNKNNKGYDEGKLDDKTREAVKQFKAFSDAKKTTGINIVDPFNLIDENGEPKVDETYSALQDYENQLNRSGYFKGNFKIDTSPITEYNKKIAYNFKINPDPTTPFGMCAQYVNGTVCKEDVYGQDAREKLGFTGPAWHVSDNIQNKGGSLLFAGLPERSALKLKNKDEINSFVKNELVKPETTAALQSLVGNGNIYGTSKVKPGDVVNIFYEGSNYAEEAYNQTAANNNRLFTTHVGIVKADDQGNLYVEHNIHGDVKKDPIGNFLTGKVKGNGKNKVSLISGITRPKYFNKVSGDASLPVGGIEYYQTDEGQFNPEGVFATKDYLAQSVSGKQTYELLKTIEKNKNGLLKDIPISEGEFSKLLRVTRALPTLETYSKSEPLTQWEKDKKSLQDTFYKEKSMGITKLKDESNLGENLRKKLITSDEELDNPVKAALPTFYSLSKNYLYLKDVANKYKIDINTDELAKLAGISWNQSVSRIAAELVKSGSYDDYVRYRESKAPDKKNFKYREVLDIYDTQTMRYGGTPQQQGIYLGKYEFKDGGLVKYQNKGEVDNTNVYINTNMYNDLYKNQELYRNMKNWDQPDVQEDSPYKSQYPLTYSLASGLKNVPRYKNTKTDDFFKLLNLIASVESKDKNIPQMDGGPGRGYYQVEPPTATTAKNRAIQLQKDLKNYGYDLPLPEKFDTNFMNLSKDEQAFYALSNIIKAASAKRENDPNYNIDFTNPGKAWIELHWAGKDSIRPNRVEHWNEINKDNKIALDENGNVILVKKQGGLVKAQKGKEYKTPTGKSIYLDPNFKTYARYKDENGNVIPTAELQKFSMIYDPQANTWDSTHSETPLQVREDLYRMGLEDRINKWLGNPMRKAKRVAEELTEGNDDPIDNIRHSHAGLYTAQSIANKTGNIPYISPALGWLGSNAMGIGHELGTIFNDARPLKYKGREALEDIFNNNAGATMSLMPIPDAAKEEALIQMSFNNKLADGIADPRGGDFYFKQSGGSIRKVKIKSLPRKNQ